MTPAVKLVSLTPDAEKTMAYCARVSSSDQSNADIGRLLRYCIKHGHWSVFEMAQMTIEIETTRLVSAQILRHRSFSFQEFSQRYAQAMNYMPLEARRQDVKNRQNSIDDLSQADKDWFTIMQADVWNTAHRAYEEALSRGIAKECARALLPMNTATRLYMTGNIRSWIHYLKVRCDESTQLEHRAVANGIKEIFIRELPTTAKAVWND